RRAGSPAQGPPPPRPAPPTTASSARASSGADLAEPRVGKGGLRARVLLAGALMANVPASAAPVTGRPPQLQGHRGARGLRPENSLPAFAAALGIGVDTLELDLGLT